MQIQLAERSQCTGCSACCNICAYEAIHMEPDSEGFLSPIINSTHCVKCGLCVAVCPVINPLAEIRQPVVVYAATHKKNEIREKSSSGGVFSALAEQILAEEGVVFGAAFDQEMAVRHIAVTNVTEIDQLRGSKYVQSDLKTTFAETLRYLKGGKKVLFCGTPCQIAGLRKVVGEDCPSLFCVDLVCLGVPSPLTWRRYLESLPIKKPSFVCFRDKSISWHKPQFLLGSTKSNISIREKFPENPYCQAFSENYGLRQSCYECNFRSGKSGSDITIGDFWGVESERPELDDGMGISIALVHTKKGTDLLQNVSLKLSEISEASATKFNPLYKSSVKDPLLRSWFFRKVRQGKFDAMVMSINSKRKRRLFLQRARGKLKLLLRLKWK